MKMSAVHKIKSTQIYCSLFTVMSLSIDKRIDTDLTSYIRLIWFKW